MKKIQEEIDKLINETKQFPLVLKGFDLTGISLAGKPD